MERQIFLGIDTSCYVTSVAIVDEGLNLLSDERRPLALPSGGRGLRQQEAVFAHVKNLAGAIEIAVERVRGGGAFSSGGWIRLAGVGASVAPRPKEGSYMPVFKVGEMAGRGIAAVEGVPFVPLSHQEGHIAAGLWSEPECEKEEFLALHISGGTTELLRVASRVEARGEERGRRIEKIDLLGGSDDLHAGQFVDRVGLAMGLPFPAGPELERLARGGDPEKVCIPSAVKGMRMSFSGPATCAIRALEEGAAPQDVAAAVERCIANTIEKVIRKAMAVTGLQTILIVGGVAANEGIRSRLRQRLERRDGEGRRLYFAEPKYSGDNAIGVAVETACRVMDRGRKG